MALVALVAMFTPIVASTEVVALRLLALILTVAHVHYAVCVVQQMCDHLKINALTLAKREPESSRQHLLRDSNTNTSSQLGLLSSQGNNNQDSISQQSDEQSFS